MATVPLIGKYKRYFTNGTTFTGALNSTVDVTLSQSKVGNDTPNYKELVRSGSLLPVQSYSASTVQNGVAKLVRFRKVARWKTPVSGAHIDKVDFDVPLVSSNLTLAAINQLYPTERGSADNKAKAELQQRIENLKWDSLVDFGEMRNTSNLLLGRISGLKNFVLDFRNVNRRNVRILQKRWTQLASSSSTANSRKRAIKLVSKDISNLYLEFNLGWMPLARSVEDALTTLAEQNTIYAKNKGVQGHERFIRDRVNSGLVSNSDYNLYYDTSERYTYDVRVGGILSKEELEKDSWLNWIGIEPTNIPLVLWELQRFSFVVDYFVNIQDILHNLRFSYFDLVKDTVYISRKIRYTKALFPKRAEATQTDPSAVYSIEGFWPNAGAAYFQEADIFTRAPLSHADSLVRLEFKLPSVKQAITVAALAIQALR